MMRRTTHLLVVHAFGIFAVGYAGFDIGHSIHHQQAREQLRVEQQVTDTWRKAAIDQSKQADQLARDNKGLRDQLALEKQRRAQDLDALKRAQARASRSRAPAPRPQSVDVAVDPSRRAMWDRLVQCEAGGRWRYGAPDVGTDPGYDFEGGPNFTHSTWVAYGGRQFAEHAYDATPEEQIVVAERVLRGQGVTAWPQCGPKTGLHR